MHHNSHKPIWLSLNGLLILWYHEKSISSLLHLTFFPSFILDHSPGNSKSFIYSFCSCVVQLILKGKRRKIKFWKYLKYKYSKYEYSCIWPQLCHLPYYNTGYSLWETKPAHSASASQPWTCTRQPNWVFSCLRLKQQPQVAWLRRKHVQMHSNTFSAGASPRQKRFFDFYIFLIFFFFLRNNFLKSSNNKPPLIPSCLLQWTTMHSIIWL